MHPMDFDGHVVTSQAPILDRMDAIERRFFFTCDMEKFECFIFDQTEAN